MGPIIAAACHVISNILQRRYKLIAYRIFMMQTLHPGEYTLTMVGKDVRIVFDNPNKELLWKLKYT
jgi:hypothetical protein